VIVAAEDVVEGKPDPEGYRKAIALINSQPPLPARLVHPHEVVAIEDSPAGIESATGAGLVTVAVANTYPAARLGAADRVVDRSADLTAERLAELHAAAGGR
jgi:beta-phosphoglucomutase-like phosphatase (HAD superfamily)